MVLYPRLIWTAPDGETTFDFNDGEDSWVASRRSGFGFPSMDHRRVDPPARHGAIYTGTRIGDRLIRLNVAMHASGWGALNALNLTMNAALNPMGTGTGQLGTLQFQHDADSDVYVIDCIVMTPTDNKLRVVGYQERPIAFWAPQPFWRKYPVNSTAIDVSQSGLSIPLSIPLSLPELIGSATITNAGQYPASPTITITGDLEFPRIENGTTGRYVKLNQVMTGGDSLVIDVANATVELNGSSVLNKMDSGSQLTRLTLPKGDNSIQVTADDGAGIATVEHYDLYLGVD